MTQDVLYVDNQPSGIGDMLREAREAQHISIRGASRRLKISEKYLEALEREDFKVLPQGAYVLGFLRNYALMLGMNYRELRELYYQVYGKEKRETDVTPVKAKRSSGFVLTPSRVIAFGAVFLGAIFFWYLFSQYQKLMEPPILNVYSPKEGDIFTSKRIKILGLTDPDAMLFINGEEVSLNNNGEFSQEYIVLENGLESLEIIAQNRINNKQTIVQRTFTVDLPSSEVITVNELGEVVEEENTELDESKLNLKLRTVDQVWFNIVIDDSTSQEFIMEKGEEKLIQADDKIFVHCGKAYATYYSLNGGEEDILSDSSVIKQTWTKEDI